MSPGSFFFASGYTPLRQSLTKILLFQRWQYTSRRENNQEAAFKQRPSQQKNEFLITNRLFLPAMEIGNFLTFFGLLGYLI
jgi:hypothetical protein